MDERRPVGERGERSEERKIIEIRPFRPATESARPTLARPAPLKKREERRGDTTLPTPACAVLARKGEGGRKKRTRRPPHAIVASSREHEKTKMRGYWNNRDNAKQDGERAAAPAPPRDGDGRVAAALAALLALAWKDGGGHLVVAPGDAFPAVAAAPPGSAAPFHRPQSIGISSTANNMAAAKMFRPEPFPMRGTNFERIVKALEGHARSTYNVLHHFNVLALPRRWEDRLVQRQKTTCYFISKPEEWSESGAMGEFVSSLQAVPVLAIHLVRRLNVFKYLSIATYNGRVAIFSIRALEKVCQWQETVDLLPPEVKTWLMDPDVVVVTSGEKRTFRTKFRGMEVTGQVDTERVFKIYQGKGVIRPAVPVERGDLSWQLAFAIGYHASTSHKNTWEQLIGECKFRVKDRDWPEWRMPGWQPDSLWKLDEQEYFFLYYNALGPLIFVSRLLRHGLTYGGLDAVDGAAPLRDCYLVFLQGAMGEEEMTQLNPLGLQSDVALTERRDRSSPAVRLYNPRFAHLRTPLEREEAKRARMAAFQAVDESALFPEPPSSTTGALGAASASDGEASDLEDGELPETAEALEEEEVQEEPLQINVGEEDLSLVDVDDNNNEAGTPGEVEEQDGNNNVPSTRREKGEGRKEGVSLADPPKYKKDNRLPKKGRRRRRSEADIREALHKLAEPSLPDSPAGTSAATAERTVRVLDEPIRLPGPAQQQQQRPPLAHRLGLVQEAEPDQEYDPEYPHRGYYTARGWEEKKEEEKMLPGPSRLVGPAQCGQDLIEVWEEDEEEEEEKPHLALRPQQGQARPYSGGGPDRRNRHSPRYAPFDYRSRRHSLLEADAEAFKQEAKAFPPAPVAVIAPDRNLILAARTARGPKPQRPAGARMGDRRRNRKLGKRLLDHPIMTKEQVVSNPYTAAPIFDKRCNFCASWHCSRYLRGTRTINCTCFKEQLELAPTRRLCDYRRCGAATDHHTAVCPTLHARCTICGCRGHTSSHGCNLADERVMERLRYDFEEVADTGVYTAKRFDNLAWGFYPYPASAPRNVVVVSYRRLSDLPVKAAIGLLDSVLQLPENRALPQGGVLESGHRLVAGGAQQHLHQAGTAPRWGEEDEDEDTSY